MSVPTGTLKLKPSLSRPLIITHPRNRPTASPMTPPIAHVMTLSLRTIARIWPRVVPTARIIPISRVRS